jgi:hypothetical protein
VKYLQLYKKIKKVRGEDLKKNSDKLRTFTVKVQVFEKTTPLL